VNEQVGVAILRAWIEGGDAPAPLKIRVTIVPDVSSDVRRTDVTSDISEACAVIQAWLEAFVQARDDGGPAAVTRVVPDTARTGKRRLGGEP
jgi:hypothetical protein